MSATARPAYEWKNLPWRTIERRVFKLQTRIYRASQHGKVKTMHRLQRLLTRSWSAKCLAVRRVTQDNQGKKTAGIDGVKALTPPQRCQLVQALSLRTRARPVRRVWIPKPHAPTERRPLGIPVMHDRANQALLKLAIEPEWEAKFEPNSYGFRPGRSCHDAIAAIFNSIKHKDKYALDADIKKCFDRINHEALLRKMGTSPTFRRKVRQWLKAGMVEDGQFFVTEEGTPQGGVISPVLANIALHGMEDLLNQRFPERMHDGVRSHRPNLVRYADDLVILHADRAVIEQAQTVRAEWLQAMGLELKPEKTRIVHTLHADGNTPPGFPFLGFTIRQFPRGKHRTGTNSKGTPLGFVTHIRPSPESGRDHHRKLRTIIRKHAASSQEALISELNPLIRGWTAYYSAVVSAAEFKRQDAHLIRSLLSWSKRRHRNSRWRQYWQPGWEFQAKNSPIKLLWHRDRPIQRHVKVQGGRSPYDGDLIYWSTRLGRHPEVAASVARLLKHQRGKCAWCGLLFTAADIVERDHIIPRSQGGSNKDENQQLLHRRCHDTKSADDNRPDRRGAG